MEDRLAALLVEVSAKALGVSFSINQHQEAILALLEDAKKKDLLDF
jgi:hypothetical protein